MSTLSTTPASSNTKKPRLAPYTYGVLSADFYARHVGQNVNVATTTGKAFKGVLIGVDQYDVIIRQETGLEILFSKGNVVYIHKG